MTQLNPVTLSAEDVNNVELSAADVHKITLSVIDWFYVQILNAIIAQAAVKLGATALCSVLSKINAESAVVLGASGSLKAPARIIGSAGMALGGTAEAEVSVTARIIALASVVLGAEAVMTTVSKIIGAAGVGLGGTANVVVPSNINGAAGVVAGASGVAAVRSLLVAQSGAQFGAQVAARCPAIIIGSAGMGMGATAELDAGAVIWTPELWGSSIVKLWLDAMDESTITKDGSNYVSQWNDKSGNNNHVYQETGNLQPLYSSASSLAGNKPAIVYPNTDTGTKLNANVEFTLREIYYVCAYKDGLDNTFDNYDTLLSGTRDWGEPRICGDMGTSNIREDIQRFQSDIYKNGKSTSSLAVLPMTLSIIRGVSGSSRSSTWTIGGNRGIADDARNWKGIICEVIGASDSLTADNVQKVEGYLAHKWELAGELPSGHPYKTNPPTV